ncbi:hypothetical protein [Piscinibacter sakaiensis]|uniref:hypothetical protein n=1 Tax=Piscinibacter sakaiensis TaxID=1547922 RepID=UPI003AAEBB38
MSVDGGAKPFCQGLTAAAASVRRFSCNRRLVLAAALIFPIASAAAEPPAPSGLINGRMCVRPLDPQRGAGDCGPVDILLLGARHAHVGFSDIVYRLELDAGRIDVILMHGPMQIDGFTTRYGWHGTRLDFSDPEKGVRYQIHFDAAASDLPR